MRSAQPTTPTAELADILSLCQFIPGPNIVGIAVCVEAKMRARSERFQQFRAYTVAMLKECSIALLSLEERIDINSDDGGV